MSSLSEVDVTYTLTSGVTVTTSRTKTVVKNNTVYLQIHCTFSSLANNATLIALTLDSAFRPADLIQNVGIGVIDTSNQGVVQVAILANGELRIINRTGSAISSAFVNICYNI